MSFEDVRNALLIAYGFLDEEEFIILYDYYQPVNFHIHTGILIHSVWMGSTLATAKLTQGWSKMIFRFY